MPQRELFTKGFWLDMVERGVKQAGADALLVVGGDVIGKISADPKSVGLAMAGGFVLQGLLSLASLRTTATISPASFVRKEHQP